MSEKTLVLIKPDGVQKQLIGQIIKTFDIIDGIKTILMKILEELKALREQQVSIKK